MEQYISKSALVAEIEKRLKTLNKDRDFKYPQIKELEALLSSLDTLLVKETDLDKEKDEYWNKLCDSEFGELLERDSTWFDDIAKHFFELGLQVNNPITAADRGTAEEIIVNLKRVEDDD